MYRYFLSYVTLQCFILLLWTWSKWWFFCCVIGIFKVW
jgi:hypothetical protein